MSKKFKGKTCVYCAVAMATTADHVVAREFFLVGAREDLPKVPSCADCNSSKSKLEHYLTALLPFGGRHTDAAANLSGMVPKRLRRNLRLALQLKTGFDRNAGKSLPIEFSKVEQLYCFIAKGLFWFHWKVLLGPGFSAKTGCFPDTTQHWIERVLTAWNTPNRVLGDFGAGTFKYEGYQATDCPEMSIWKFSIFGGIQFRGDPNFSGAASQIVTLTGPDGFLSKYIVRELVQDLLNGKLRGGLSWKTVKHIRTVLGTVLGSGGILGLD